MSRSFVVLAIIPIDIKNIALAKLGNVVSLLKRGFTDQNTN